MFIKVDLYTFRQQFKDMGRGDNFSYEGLELLFDYLEELEHCEEEYELDVIGLCCDFAESSPESVARDYGVWINGLDEDEIIVAARQYLEDEGVLVGETDAHDFVYRQH
jgi:hypothetical protein